MELNHYPRRILLCVTGLSPQIITETLYYLAVRQEPVFAPTEIYLITTAEGAQRTRLTLLSNDPGWFHQLCRDYDLPAILFNEDCIHILHKANGSTLSDIRTLDDNEAAADMITEVVRALTANPDSALHASIAGGRKTMGFYLGYAMSLFGRPQDRLSHVLVSSPFESNQQFFYPTRQSRVIYTPPPEQRPLDTRDAQVTLAEIPFVRLRDGLPDTLLEGGASFSETVQQAQRSLEPPTVFINLTTREVRCGERNVVFKPVELAFYTWFIDRKLNEQTPMRWTEADKEGLLRIYRQIVGEYHGDYDRAVDALAKGMTKEYFEEKKSKVNSTLKRVLGHIHAQPYQIRGTGKRPNTRYEVSVNRERITVQFDRSKINNG